MQLSPLRLHSLPQDPLVSVLMINRNYEMYVGEAIDSVLAQTYEKLELIVCDNASSDHSPDVIRARAARDPRVTFLQEGRPGVAHALNRCQQVARGDILCLLDSDDLYYPAKVQKVVAAFQSAPDAGFCAHRHVRVGSQLRPLPAAPCPALPQGWIAPVVLRLGGYCGIGPTSTLSFRRPVADAIFPIPSNICKAADSYLMSAATLTTAVVSIQQELTAYRIHTQNISAGAKITPASLPPYLQLLADITFALRAHVLRRHGADAAAALSLEDHPEFWVLKRWERLYGANKPRQYTDAALLADLPWLHRTLWRFLYALPKPAASVLVAFWQGRTTATHACRRVFDSTLPNWEWRSAHATGFASRRSAPSGTSS